MTRELTARSIVAGIAIGAALAIANLYMGLRTGFWDAGFVTASILGFGLCARSRTYTPLENNITQTLATALASVPSTAGLLGAVPALLLLGHGVSGTTVLLWGLSLGVIGALLAMLLRPTLIEREGLPFPTGRATSELIAAMHAAGREAFARTRSLAASAAVAMAQVWLRDGRPAWIPAATAFPGGPTLGISWSPMLMGAGMLVGLQIALSWMLGALVAWCVLAPRLVARGIVAGADYDSLAAWLTWPGVGLMAAGTVVLLVEQIPSWLRGLRDLRSLRTSQAGAGTVILLVASAALVLVVGWRAFAIHPVAGLLALLLCVPLGTVAARAAGETDVAPLSQIGQLTQLGVARSAASANIGAASIVAGSGAQLTSFLWALRVGHDLRASPRKQLWAVLIGVAVGAPVAAAGYWLLMAGRGLGSADLPVPPAKVWMAVADLITRGGAAMPLHAKTATGIAFGVGLVLAAAARGRLARWMPSAVAAGIGFVTPASYAGAIVVGAIAIAVARAFSREWADRHGAPIAAGAIGGESLIGLVIAALRAAHRLG